MSESARFREDLIQAVGYGLAVPVEPVRVAMCERIERKYPLARDEASEKLEPFHKALQGTLGAGAKVIERLIAKNLYSQLDLNFTAHANWTIIEYFDHAKKANGGG